MARVSKTVAFVGIILVGMFAFSACAFFKPQDIPGLSPGHYQNDEYGFTVDFPDHYKPLPLGKNEVLRIANTNEWTVPALNVIVTDAEAGATLDSSAHIERIRKIAPGTSRFKVVFEKKVRLNDGTPGLVMRFTCTHVQGPTMLQVASLWVLKDGKSISTNVTTVMGDGTPSRALMKMVTSLKFF